MTIKRLIIPHYFFLFEKYCYLIKCSKSIDFDSRDFNKAVEILEYVLKICIIHENTLPDFHGQTIISQIIHLLYYLHNYPVLIKKSASDLCTIL